MAAPQVGVVSVRVNGDVLALSGNVTHSLGGLVRETILGPAGVAGFKVSFVAPFVEADSIDSADVDMDGLQKIENATITTQLRNGKTIVLNGASVVGQLETSNEDGKFTVRFEGSTAKEI